MMLSSQPSTSTSLKSVMMLGLTPNVMLSYLVFLGLAGAVWHLLSDQDFSMTLTFSVMTQTLAFGLLALQVENNRSVAGLSGRTLVLYATMLVLRLSSTLFYNGYLPVDRTGDHVYQISDIISLLLVCQLLYKVHRSSCRGTYQKDKDTVDVQTIVFLCFVLAVIVHPEMDHALLFDIAWTTSLYVDSVAMIPQIWMITKNGGLIDGLTGHSVALMAFSRFLSGLFWYHAYEDVAEAHHSPMGIPGTYAAAAVVAAHALMILFLGDFLFYYTKNVFNKGLYQEKMDVQVSSNTGVYDI